MEKRLVGIKNLPQNEPLLQGHFPEHPIFPGALTLEALFQASACLAHLEESPAALGGVPPTGGPKSFLVESRIKHLEPVYPGAQLQLEAQLLTKDENVYTFKVRATVDGAEVTKGQLVLACGCFPADVK